MDENEVNALFHKLSYIQSQNEDLRERVNELETLLKLKDQTIAQITKNDLRGNFSKESEISTMNLVIDQLQQENEILQKSNHQLCAERDHALTKSLINEQIAVAAERHEKEIVYELSQKLRQLKEELKLRENIIIRYESQGVEQPNLLVLKVKEITSLSEQNVKFHQEKERLNAALLQLFKENEVLKEQKDELKLLNSTLTNEIIKLKMSTPRGIQRPFGNQKKISKLLMLQKKLVDSDSDEDEGNEQLEGPQILSPIFSPLPVKVQMQTKTNESKKKNNLSLDLAKAQQLQRKIVTQMLEMEKGQGDDDSIYKQKLIKIQKELYSVRQHHLDCLNQIIILQEQYDQCKRINENCLQQNNILVKSNQLYQEKWRQLFQLFQFYRGFYLENKHLLGNSKFIQQISPITKSYMIKKSCQISFEAVTNQISRTLYNNNNLSEVRESKDETQTQIQDIMIQDLEKFIRQNTDQTEHSRNNMINFNITDDLKIFQDQLEKDEQKKILLTMAKDLYSDLSAIKLSRQKTKPKLKSNKKRTQSNILDYYHYYQSNDDIFS